MDADGNAWGTDGAGSLISDARGIFEVVVVPSGLIGATGFGNVVTGLVSAARGKLTWAFAWPAALQPRARQRWPGPHAPR